MRIKEVLLIDRGTDKSQLWAIILKNKFISIIKFEVDEKFKY